MTIQLKNPKLVDARLILNYRYTAFPLELYRKIQLNLQKFKLSTMNLPPATIISILLQVE